MSGQSYGCTSVLNTKKESQVLFLRFRGTQTLTALQRRGRVGPEDGSEQPAQTVKPLFFSCLWGLKSNLHTGRQNISGK